MTRYTNINEVPLKEYNAIPDRYNKEIDGVMRQIIGYRGLSETVHHADGWRVIEKSEIDLDTQYYGDLTYNSETDTAHYEVVERTLAEQQALAIAAAEKANKEAFAAFQQQQAAAAVQNLSNSEALANPGLFPVLSSGTEAKEGNKYYSVIDGLLKCTNDCTVAAVTSNLPNFEKVTA